MARTRATTAFADADVMFAQMMIPHHEQAVQMSDMLLAKSGVDRGVASLARQIKAAQQPEIDTMASWLKAWGKPAESGMGGMNHGGDDGMMTDAEMTELRDSDGGAAQKLYLEGMLAHHQGAVTMARAEIANGKNPDAVELAKRIVSSQSAEITTIRGMLARM